MRCAFFFFFPPNGRWVNDLLGPVPWRSPFKLTQDRDAPILSMMSTSRERAASQVRPENGPLNCRISRRWSTSKCASCLFVSRHPALLLVAGRGSGQLARHRWVKQWNKGLVVFHTKAVWWCLYYRQHSGTSHMLYFHNRSAEVGVNRSVLQKETGWN